ncbi:MAG: endonuclease [Frankiales bacterium]|nr:endonuclease [Frankiales bacterium]
MASDPSDPSEPGEPGEPGVPGVPEPPDGAGGAVDWAFAAEAAEAAAERREAASERLSRLAVLAAADFDLLGEVGRIDALIELQTAQAWLDSLQVELLAAVADHDPTPEQWSREEVAAALRLSAVTAAGRLADAALIAHDLPQTLTALRDGRITAAHARAVADTAADLPAAVRAELEHRVLPKAEIQTPAQTRQVLRRAALQLDPRAAEERHQAAAADRHVRLTPEPDGMATLSAYLPAPDAQACLYALNRLAARSDHSASGEGGLDHGQGAGRTVGQRRADALTAALLGGVEGSTGEGATAGQPRRPRRPVAEVGVIVGLSTLVGRDSEPGWLEGYGPVTADTARQLAHDPTGTWRRLLVNPYDGQLLDFGRATYEPPAALHDHVMARDGTCTFSTCRVASRRCDLDHITPYPDGSTSPGNLHAAHRRHHNAKTHGGWTVRRDDSTNTTTWISPQGRAYPSQPPERWSVPPPSDAPRDANTDANSARPPEALAETASEDLAGTASEDLAETASTDLAEPSSDDAAQPASEDAAERRRDERRG